MQITLTGMDITAMYSSLSKCRKELPITGIDYEAITAAMKKLENLNTLVDYTLEPKRG